MAYLTDRALASGVTLSDLLHIVITGDTSQNPDGSSYKATIQQVGDALSGSSFNTYVFSGNADVATSTLTFLNNDGGTFTVTNSAALFSDNDINVTGGTYNPSNGCVTFTTNSGTTFDVCGFLTGFTDTYVTGGTLTGTDLILDWNIGGSVPPIDLSTLSATTYWTSGSSGNYSLKTINDSTVDSLGDYTISSGFNNLAEGNYASIIGGNDNTINNTNNASIIGGSYGLISGSTSNSSLASSIFGGLATSSVVPNKILESISSTIVGGFRNNIEYNSFSILNGGQNNSIIKSYTPHLPIDNYYNSILNGQNNTIDTGRLDSIIGGSQNTITYNVALSGLSAGNIIAGGSDNLIDGHSNSAIIAGNNNTINFDSISNNGIFVGGGNTITGGGFDSIVGGTGNTINGNPLFSSDFGNTIIGGKDNTIFTGTSSTIIGGINNTLISTTGPSFRIENSVILGGQNLTGTTNDTVYVPYLNINSLGAGTPINNLGIDSSGNVVTGTTGSVSDIYVTGGTFDNNTDTITFTNTSGGTFDVTGITDTFVVAGTFNDTTDTLSLLRNDGNFVNVTGITDTFVVAGTFNDTTNTLSLLRNDGNFVSITGVTDTFTGNTSGDCITDLYVTNLYGCSPITVHDTIESVTGIIRTSGGTGAELNLKDSFGPNGTWSITSDNGGYGVDSAWLYGQPSNGSQLAYQVTGGEAIGISVFAGGLTPLLGNGKEVIIANNTSLSVNSGNIDKRSIFVGTRNSTMLSGVTNSVVLGGVGLSATQDDTVYTSNLNVSGNLDVFGQTTLSGSGQNVLTVIGSGDTQPLFTVQGSSGELFTITDSLVGSLFSVNDISGLPILEVFDNDTVHIGSYQAPSLNTTVLLNPGTGLSDVYSIPVSAYTGAFFDYTVLNSTGARAGNIMSIFSGSTVEFSETTTNDIGSTSDVTFTMSNDGSNATLQVSATTTGWEVKTIVRSI